MPLGSTIDSPAAAITDAGLHIVVRGSDGRSIWYTRLDRYSFQFSGWRQLPGSTPSAPSMTSDGYRVWLAVRGMDNKVYVNALAASWGGWRRVPTGSTAAGLAIELGSSVLHLAVIGTDGKSIWYAQLDLDGS
jgi:hypothetical protein